MTRSTHWRICVTMSCIFSATSVCGATGGDEPVQPAPALDYRDLGPYEHARLRPIPLPDVVLLDDFWKPVRDQSQLQGVPDYLRKFEQHGYIDNFRFVARQQAEKHHGGPNNDEFVYKLLEAMGVYAAENETIAALHKQLADTILAAQQPDGYLNTYYENLLVKQGGAKRFQPKNRFELYNFGHFTQAAIAHWRATGDRRLLDAAVKFADLLVAKFADPHDLPYELYRGPINLKYEHPNHELAMVELYRATGDRRYLDFTRQTLEEYEFFGPKFNEIWGHAVQETLLCAGATDLFLETGDPQLWKVVQRLWNDMHDHKLYITGGVGASARGESYGKAFELPNATAYCETCAAISLVIWNQKMLLATGDSKYADAIAQSLYNNVLSGIALTGTEYFYRNPLYYDPAKPRRNGLRAAWFACSCCPPNVHRLVASLGQYVYTSDAGGVQVNLYTSSTLRHQLSDGAQLSLTQTADYPWTEDIALTVSLDKPAEFTLSLRIPAWCQGAVAKIQGEDTTLPGKAGQYLKIHRRWASGDIVQLHLPLVPRVELGNSRVSDQEGRLAIARGPIVYCLEAHDNPGVDLDRLAIAPNATASARLEPDILRGIVTLSGPGQIIKPGADPKPVVFHAIPYYAWANRGPCKMLVWVKQEAAKGVGK